MEDANPPVTPPPPVYSAPPPVIIPPSQPRSPKRSRGWMVFAIVLLVMLILSVLVNFSQLAGRVMRVGGSRSVGPARLAGPRLDETILEDNHASAKIAVIDVDGVISGSPINQQGYSMVDVIKAQLDQAQEDNRVKAVILRVDSPGGEVLASDEISDAIKNFQTGKKSNGSEADNARGKPVIVSMGNLAASGGYYISAPCRYIIANKMTITGSIGVIMHGFNYRGLLDKVGVAPEVYKSGKFKDMMSPTREPEEVTQEERDMVQSLINEVYGDFKDVVKKGRTDAHEQNKSEGHALADNWTDYADGRVLSGTEAEKLGFVDEVGNFQTAVERAKSFGGISGDANLVQYPERYDISDLFHIFGETKAQTSVKLDLGFDAPRLQEGRLYFMSSVLSH
jgi:protease-4